MKKIIFLIFLIIFCIPFCALAYSLNEALHFEERTENFNILGFVKEIKNNFTASIVEESNGTSRIKFLITSNIGFLDELLTAEARRNIDERKNCEFRVWHNNPFVVKSTVNGDAKADYSFEYERWVCKRIKVPCPTLRNLKRKCERDFRTRISKKRIPRTVSVVISPSVLLMPQKAHYSLILKTSGEINRKDDFKIKINEWPRDLDVDTVKTIFNGEGKDLQLVTTVFSKPMRHSELKIKYEQLIKAGGITTAECQRRAVEERNKAAWRGIKR